jgi:hypothetical protein
MPQDLAATREGMKELGERMEDLQESTDARDARFKRWAPWFAGLMVMMIASIVFLGVGTWRNAEALKNDKEERVAGCKQAREDIKRSFEASADALVNVIMNDPANQSPADQARLETFREPLRRAYTAELPTAESCE